MLQIPTGKESKISCSNVFSDVLHRPFACAHIDLSKYLRIPDENLIPIFDDLSSEEFAAKWNSTPFILKKCIRSWPAFGKWNIDFLRSKYAGVDFRAEAIDWPFGTYCDYIYDNQDESPLYLFDRKFVESMGIEVGRDRNGEYWKPECFGADLFEMLGRERPAHRWLIVGPKRSGSTFHKDPNATSAWNAVLQGSKYWIMFPPSANVPGVYVSGDGGEVTSPLSIAEWLLGFHEEARKLPECLEGICREGEILHVPSGWWHLVVNLESGVAITQNFVPPDHLPGVLEFLKNKADQVTGFETEVVDPYGLFLERLRERCPDLLGKALNKMEAKANRKRKWGLVAGAGEEDRGGDVGFSFGFAEDGVEDG